MEEYERFFVQRRENTAVFDTHLHDFFEINFALSAGTSVVTEQRLDQTEAGMVFVFPPYSFHRLDSHREPYCRYLLFFSERMLASDAPVLLPILQYFKKPCVILLSAEERETLCRLFAQAERCMGETDELAAFRRVNALGEVLAFLKNAGKHLTAASDSEKNEIGAVLAYIKEHLAEPQSLELLCREFGIGKTKLCGMIRGAIGMSYREYLLHLRLAQATEELAHGRSVTETANRCGFNSYANFIRTFHRRIGITPYRYGKQARSTKFREKIDK